MKNLKTYKEFTDSNSETSNYEPPEAAVMPPEDDKIYAYVKQNIKFGPRWGLKLKNQEAENKKLGDR